MTLLDVSVTNVALPSIGRALGSGPSQLQWVISGYTLAFGLVPVLAGRLGDDHGRRLMFQVGVSSFALTSLLAGIAPVAGVLIAARVAQGLAGGLINPQVSGLVQQMFGGAERGKAFGILGTVVGVGTATGPLVGGGLIALGGPHLGWRLVFFVNIPVGIAVIVAARRLLPADRSSGRHRLDIAGAALLGLVLLCVLFAAVEYDSLHDARLALLLIPAAVIAVVFVRRERRLTAQRLDPLIDMTLFRQHVLHRRRAAGDHVLPGHGRPAAGAVALLPGRARVHRAAVGAGDHGLRARQRHRRPAGRAGRHAHRAAAAAGRHGVLRRRRDHDRGPGRARLGRGRRAGAGAGAVRHGRRLGRDHHPEPGPDPDGRRPGRRQYRRRRPADLATHRPGHRAGRDRRRVLRRRRRRHRGRTPTTTACGWPSRPRWCSSSSPRPSASPTSS